MRNLSRVFSFSIATVALLFALIALAGACAPSAMANTVYTYTGAPYTTCVGAYVAGCSSISLTGTLDLSLSSSQLENLDNFVIPASDIASFSFTDGFDVSLNQNTAAFSFFEISSNAQGDITNWAIVVLSTAPAPDAVTTGVSGIVSGHEVETFDISGSNLTFDCTPKRTPPFDCQVTEADGGSAGVGGAWSPQGTTTAPTPEPSSLFLLGSGLLAFGPFLRRFARA